MTHNRIKILTVKKRLLFMLVLGYLSNLAVTGQESNTMYFMKMVPQSYQINPAIQPGCRVFLGLPLASPFQMSFENSGFSLEDIIFPLGDSLVTFLHPEASKSDFLNTLSPVNFTQVSMNTDLLSFGYRRNNLYYTFDFSEKAYAGFSYNDDLFNFLLLGNRRGDQFIFSNTNVDIISYFEYATGISKNINDRLTTGTRVKLLFGHANVTTRSKDLELITDEDWTLTSDMDIRLNVPGLKIPVDENGEFDPASLYEFETDLGFDDNIWGNPESDTNSNAIGFEEMTITDVIRATFGNKGLALDLGMQYKFSDKLDFSASLVDLGAIRWNSNTYRLKNRETIVYRGIEYDPNDTAGGEGDYADSLLSQMRFTVDTDPYYTWLPIKLYLGCSFDIIDEISLGLLSRTEYFKRRLREQVTLSANFYPLKILAVSLSYSIMNNTFDNIGFGLASRLGPFNLYLLTDNLPTSYALDQSSNIIIPYRARNINIRFGMNLVFGCGKEKKSLRDLPLIY